jgi:hypothetical protein
MGITKLTFSTDNIASRAATSIVSSAIEICKITDVRVDGNQVIYTASCGGRASKVVTTSYHGDSSEGTDSTGGKTEAKRVGACK